MGFRPARRVLVPRRGSAVPSVADPWTARGQHSIVLSRRGHRSPFQGASARSRGPLSRTPPTGDAGFGDARQRLSRQGWVAGGSAYRFGARPSVGVGCRALHAAALMPGSDGYQRGRLPLSRDWGSSRARPAAAAKRRTASPPNAGDRRHVAIHRRHHSTQQAGCRPDQEVEVFRGEQDAVGDDDGL